MNTNIESVITEPPVTNSQWPEGFTYKLHQIFKLVPRLTKLFIWQCPFLINLGSDIQPGQHDFILSPLICPPNAEDGPLKEVHKQSSLSTCLRKPTQYTLTNLLIMLS
jgi:hypothetical protein